MIDEKIQYPVITLSILYFYYNKDERIVSLRQLQHIADKLTKRSYIEVDNVVTYEKFYSYFISHESYFKERGPYLFELINPQAFYNYGPLAENIIKDIRGENGVNFVKKIIVNEAKLKNLFSKNEKDVLDAINDGCDVDAIINIDMKTPLHHAVLNNNLNALKALLEAGAKINVVDVDWVTPIYEAVKHENIEAINILLQYNPDLEICRGHDKETPLMEACANGNLDIIELLLLHDADINKKDADGKTSHDYADLSDKPDEVKSLLKKYQ